jgi:hypothetical protein
VPFFTAINICMQHITGVTLVDITRTGVTRTRPDYDLERDQQRNWETVLQCIGLRAQPFDVQGPFSQVVNLNGSDFGEMYTGDHRVWFWSFSVEHTGVWNKEGDQVHYLNHDVDEVPIIMGLTETARFILPIFYTSGAIKNVFFRLGRIDLNSI